MRLYPELARPRNRQLRRDILVALSLILFGFFAWAVRAAVLTLTAISTGFTRSAQSAEEAWDSVGSVLAGIPFLGADLQRSAQDLSASTLGSAAQTGESITEAVQTTANVLGFVTFAAPAAVLLVLWLPRRLHRARAWTAADQVLAVTEAGWVRGSGGASPSGWALDPPAAPEWADGAPGGAGDGAPGDRAQVASMPPAELLALRALCDLPFADLVRFTPRPFEAFSAGDYAPLVRALYAREGLVSPL